MTDLRIRSEAVPDSSWSAPFLPPAARVAADDMEDFDSDFGPLLAASARALTGLFGLLVTVRPGRRPITDDVLPRADAMLADLLATIRLGGNPARAMACGVGTVFARQVAAIADTLDCAAVDAWPAECRMPDFDIEISCAVGDAVVVGAARILAPPRPPRPVPLPLATLRAAVLALPIRVRVELACDMTGITGLLPLRAGVVLPISPAAEMPLIIGHHRIGLGRISALPDGRQQAEILTIGVEPQGGRI